MAVDVLQWGKHFLVVEQEKCGAGSDPWVHGSDHSVSGSLCAQPDMALPQSESEPDESSELEALLLLSDLFSLSSTSSSTSSF